MIMKHLETTSTVVYYHNHPSFNFNKVNSKIGNFNPLVVPMLPLHKSLLEHQQYSSPEPDV